MPSRLCDSQGDRRQIHDERAPQPQRDRYRHLFDDQIGHAGVTKEAFPEIQPQVVAEHDPEALGCRLVEAVKAFDLGNQVRVQALPAAIAIAASRDFGSSTGNPAGCAFEALQFSDRLFDRPSGCGLDDDEVDEQDAEQSRDDEQKAPENIREHAYCSVARVALVSVSAAGSSPICSGSGLFTSGLFHQVISPTS